MGDVILYRDAQFIYAERGWLWKRHMVRDLQAGRWIAASKPQLAQLHAALTFLHAGKDYWTEREFPASAERNIIRAFCMTVAGDLSISMAFMSQRPEVVVMVFGTMPDT